jgi:hypothetical protein
VRNTVNKIFLSKFLEGGKKSGCVFSDVKTYGKNINNNTNGNSADVPQNIK